MKKHRMVFSAETQRRRDPENWEMQSPLLSENLRALCASASLRLKMNRAI